MLENEKLKENERYFDEWAKSYDLPIFQLWMRKFYQPIINMILSQSRVLDISCGSGEFLLKLSQKNDMNLEGVDYSGQMVIHAQKKLKDQAKIQKMDAHYLSFDDNSFDYVVSSEAFHHYHDQLRALEEMRRVAKIGGKVIVSDINFFIKTIHRLFEKFEPGCVKVNSKQEIRDLFAKVGLTKIKQERSFIFSVITQGINT